MARREFRAETKRQAWERSGGFCEAEGEIYGLPTGIRCNTDMSRAGVRYDHVDPDANSKDNSLENCCACCPKCHDWKTNKRDRPLIAKTNHQQDAARSIRGPEHRPMPCGRDSLLKKKIGGRIVPRYPSEAANGS